VRLVTQLLRPGVDLAVLTATPGLLPALVDVLSAPLHESVWLPGLLHTAELLQVSLSDTFGVFGAVLRQDSHLCCQPGDEFAALAFPTIGD
jgi:hypothetical protein